VLFRSTVAKEFVKVGSTISYQLLSALTFLFPDVNRWDYKGLVVMLEGMPTYGSLLFDVTYAALYCVLALSLAAWVYRSRDIK